MTNNSSSSSAYIQQYIPVQPFSSYIITFWARTSSANGCKYGGDPNLGVWYTINANSGGEWTLYQTRIVTGSETAWQFQILNADTTTSLDVDDIQITKGATTLPGFHGNQIGYPETGLNVPVVKSLYP